MKPKKTFELGVYSFGNTPRTADGSYSTATSGSDGEPGWPRAGGGASETAGNREAHPTQARLPPGMEATATRTVLEQTQLLTNLWTA